MKKRNPQLDDDVPYEESTDLAGGNEPADVTILMDEGEATEFSAAPAAPGALPGGKDDDVFVILPGQSEGEIPVVETETVFDEPTQAMGGDTQLDFGTDSLGATEMVDESLLGGDTPSFDDATLFDGGTDLVGPTEIVSEDDLEALATELDDDSMLVDDVGSDYAGDESIVDAGFAPEGATAGGGGLVKVFVAFAAVAAIGVGVYFFAPEYLGLEPKPALAVSNAPLPVGSDSATTNDAGADTDPSVIVETVPGAGGTEDPVRVAFQGQVDFALRTGFQWSEGFDE